MARLFEPAQHKPNPVTRKFSKEKFLANAKKGIKQNLGSHIDTLDGMEVDFADDERHGAIGYYIHEGKEHYLYPVLPEWCKEV